MDVVINFSTNQKLPPGYRVEWWPDDEHFHWVIDENNYSDIYSSRWQAYRAAWKHYKLTQ